MGNTYCAGAREKIGEKKEATKELYANLANGMKNKYEKAKTKSTESYIISKLRAKGYSLNYFSDNGETKVITDFEGRIPLCMVALDEFDHPLAKMMSGEGDKSITIA